MTKSQQSVYIGIDIGGTSTRLGCFHSLDTSEFTSIARFSTHQSYEQQLQNIIVAVQQSGTEEIAGIGVSIGGRLAQDGQSVLVAPNLPEYVGKPFANDLSSRFSCPVYLAHDPVCGLLCEKEYGHLRDRERCAYLTLS